MGTWSAGIFGNDTSCEVKEYFYEKYNCGEDVAAIRADIWSTYSKDIEDSESEDRTNILLALAYCLWETMELDSALLKEIEDIIECGRDIQICTQLGADKAFIRNRRAELQKYRMKISCLRDKARRRKKPPVEIDSIYKNGACLAFRYNDDLWGAVIVVESKYFRRKIEGHFLQTDLHTAEIPTIQQILKSHVLDNSYHKHKSDYDYYDNRFTSMMDNWQNSKTIEKFYQYSEQFFTIIGYLPAWDDSYAGSFGGRNPYTLETYEQFKEYYSNYLKNRLESIERTAEDVAEINDKFIPGKQVVK